MDYPLNEDTESWNEEMYDKLSAKIKSHFKLNGDIIIKYGDTKLDVYEDLLDEYEACKENSDFHDLHLHVTCENDSDSTVM